MKNLIAITLLLALVLTPAIAFAGEKTTPTGNKPAPASAKKGKVKEKCIIPKLEHEEKLPSGETVTIKDPIPDNLSDKCYCKATFKKYINTKTATPTMSARFYLVMTNREFKCFFPPPQSPKHVLTEDERIEIVKRINGTDLRHILNQLPFSEYPLHMP